ncbi:MAG: AAA family ATPase, partial [Bdellovibrio sp.]
MNESKPSSKPISLSSSTEKLSGVVERVTFHNEKNGWSVLKVAPFNEPNKRVTVLVHQAKIFAGASIEFWGNWSHHPKHGRQFRASSLNEKKPASAAALEKYLGSGLIKGVGPKIAQRIVRHFREQTLFVFESDIEALMKVPGIAHKKLLSIKTSWEEHRSIRDVMIFLQGYGISSLFATKIYKTYGNKAVETVSGNPYRLAHDIYGIGFFSADRIALAMGFDRQGEARIEAGIKHVLAASREEGHCFLMESQILDKNQQILKEEIRPELQQKILQNLLEGQQIKSRSILATSGRLETCYYSRTLFYDELNVARSLGALIRKSSPVDEERVQSWVDRHCKKHRIRLSSEQRDAVCGIPRYAFSILTGGPGVGKTTCTRVLVGLLKAMQKKVLLAAPTGRAAQRMTELMEHEAKTLHRLLEWAPHLNAFNKNSQNPLDADFLIVDESSMLDIQLASSLIQAVPRRCQLLFIGDPDQLPSVGAGNVLSDLLKTTQVPRFRLTQVFRQAQTSSIVRFAHEINTGVLPKVNSPLQQPQAFREGHDCLFLDADEANQEQIRFIQRAKRALEAVERNHQDHLLQSGDRHLGRMFKGSEGIEVDELYRPSAP